MNKPKTISKLKKELWTIFSRYVRNRDNWTCISCGLHTTDPHGMHGGHYIARAACNPEFYFGETNVNAQCYRCNHWLEGHRVAYRKAIIARYGEKELERIEHHYRDSIVWSTEDYLEKIEEYKEKLKTVEKPLGQMDYESII